MAGFDFPDNPITGDQATGANGITYVWDGYKWANGTVITTGQLPAGANGQVQYNNNGVFGAGPQLVWDSSKNFLGIGGAPVSAVLMIMKTVAVGTDIVSARNLSPSAFAQVRIQNDTTGALSLGVMGSGYGNQLANTGQCFVSATTDLVFSTGTSGTPQVMRITAGGRVGIMTPTPQAILDVVGNVFIEGSGSTPASGAGLNLFTASGTSYIYSRNYGAITYQPLTIMASDISAWPTGSLQVNSGYLSVGGYNTSGVQGDICVADPNSPGQASGRIRFGVGGASGPNILFDGTSWVFTPALPGSSPAGADSQIQFNNAGAFGASPNLNWYDSMNRLFVNGYAVFQGGCQVQSSSSAMGMGISWAGLVFWNSSSQNEFQLQKNSVNGDLRIQRFDPPGTVQPTLVMQLIRSNGFVAIATPGAPAYQLDVGGDINISGTYRVNGVPIASGGSQTPWTQPIDAAGFSLSHAGNIGIGIAATGVPLWISHATTGNSIYVQNSSSAGSAVIGLSNDAGQVLYVGQAGSGSGVFPAGMAFLWTPTGMVFLTSGGTERMRLTGAGNVGIGTPSPSNILTVNSGASFIPSANTASAIMLNGGYGGGILLADGGVYLGMWSVNGDLQLRAGGTSAGFPTPYGHLTISHQYGNVGIGVNSPQSPLDVGGLISCTYLGGQAATAYNACLTVQGDRNIPGPPPNNTMTFVFSTSARILTFYITDQNGTQHSANLQMS